MSISPAKMHAFIFVFFLLTSISAHTFSDHWILNMQGTGGAVLTLPSISKDDLSQTGFSSVSGMSGFVPGGEVSFGYIWDTSSVFGLSANNVFSGISALFTLGISQGYTGIQIEIPNTSPTGGAPIIAKIDTYYTPIITAGVTSKIYLFNNRMAIGLFAGAKFIADIKPDYVLYTSGADSETLPAREAGNLYLTDKDTVNLFIADFKLLVEYNIPVMETVEVILGGYAEFSVYPAKYIMVPDCVSINYPCNTMLPSYFLNTFEGGVRIGLGFKL